MDRIALLTPCGAVGTIDLRDVNIVGLQRLCDARTIGTGALDADAEDLAEATRPADRRPIPGRTGGEFGIAEKLTGIGDRGQMDGVEVSVDADDDATSGCHDGGVLSVQ